MNLITFDNILKDPKKYVEDIESFGFQEISSGDRTFTNIQPRDNNDEFAQFMLSIFPGYKIKWNVIRKSDPNSESAKLSYDGMTGDITAILFLNDFDRKHGTVIYDENKDVLCEVHSKFNRMVAFDSSVVLGANALDSDLPKSDAKMNQVIFLEEIK